MAKVRFQFNPHTLNFDIIERSVFGHIIKNILPQLLVSLILGIFLFLGVSQYIDSPAEKKLIQENKAILFDYQILNKEVDAVAEQLTQLQKRDDEIYRMIFQSKPVPEAKRKAGYGGSDRYASFKKYTNANVLVSTSEKIDILSKKMLVQSESFEEVKSLASKREEMAACIPAIQPISIKELIRFGPYGMRFHPILHYWRMHKGVDLTARRGTPIHAAGDGIVVESQHAGNGFGNVVKIDHGFGYLTVYAHCHELKVEVGQKVKRGEVIATVGSTGLSTSDHLHYEVHVNGNDVNPVNFYYDDLCQDEYERMLKISSSSDHIFE